MQNLPTASLSALPRLEGAYGPTMTVEQVAAELGITAATIYNRPAGSFPILSFRIGGRRRFRTVMVAAFIDGGGEG